MPDSLPSKPSIIPPSEWVVRHAVRFPKEATVLDLACGAGRHACWLAGQGYSVFAVDRNFDEISKLSVIPGIETACLDLEGDTWPLAGRQFGGIVVTNYLWRTRLPDLMALLAPGGVLIYETFMVGNAAYGKPSNPDFLLAAGELRSLVENYGWTVLAFEEGYVDQPKPAMRQAICAGRP